MPTFDFNKKLVECEWLTKLTSYVSYAYKYILYIPTHIYLLSIYRYVFYKKLWNVYAQLLPDENKIKAQVAV
jgi:hypothetical protein